MRATLDAPSSVQESGQTWTVYPLEIQETLAGDAQSLPKYQNKPSVWLLGGIDAGPSLPPSGEVMLLLYKSRFDSPLVGFTQGLYSVQAGSAAGSKVVVGLPAGTPGVAAVPVAPAPANAQPPPAQPYRPVHTSCRPTSPTPTAPPPQPPPPVATTAAPETPTTASPPPAPIAPVTSDSATIPSVAPGAPAATVPAPTLPTPPVAATTPAPAVPAQPTPPPTAPAPTAPKTPAASTARRRQPTAAPLPPGQMTLDAFRKAVLAARAKAGK